jgi:hypothetical protein
MPKAPVLHPAESPSSLARVAPALAAALAGLIVFRGALAYFFSQDDFHWLARAAGLAPRLTGPWRYLSQQGIYDLLRPLAGLNAAPYHALSLVVHMTCAALLASLLTRWVSRPAALVGAAFFATHPALFDALYWLSAIADSMALMFALVTLLLALRTDRLRWMALPAFALSLMSKESTLLLPVVVAAVARFDRARRGEPARRMAPLVLSLGALSVAHAASFTIGGVFGSHQGPPGSSPYAFGIGVHMVDNALTYLGWTASFTLPQVHGFKDAVDPDVEPWGIVALALWLLGLASRRLRRDGWFWGGVMRFAFALPVLGLSHHTYHYYLYEPLAGTAWCVAVAFGTVTGRGRLAWSMAAVIAAALTVNGVLLVHKIETMPFQLPELRASAIVDRARIAANVQRSLASADLPPGVTLLFWSPIASSLGPNGEPLPGPAPQETYWERNVRGALLDGLAVRVLFPQVAGVRFVREFEPTPPGHLYAVYRPEGRLGVASPAALDSIVRSAGAAR